MARQFRPGQLQTGSLYNISSSYAITASFALNGGGVTINTGSFATTGSNLFYGLQTISSSVDSVLDLHMKNDGLWAFRIYNDLYSSSSIGLASWVDNTGIAFLGTETEKPLYLYNNGQSNGYQPTIIVSSSGVTVKSNANDIFLIKNFNNQPILTVSQSGVIIVATQSVELTSTAPNGGIYFTSSSFFVGLD